jgi:hypothetical protein
MAKNSRIIKVLVFSTIILMFLPTFQPISAITQKSINQNSQNVMKDESCVKATGDNLLLICMGDVEVTITDQKVEYEYNLYDQHVNVTVPKPYAGGPFVSPYINFTLTDTRETHMDYAIKGSFYQQLMATSAMWSDFTITAYNNSNGTRTLELPAYKENGGFCPCPWQNGTRIFYPAIEFRMLYYDYWTYSELLQKWRPHTYSRTDYPRCSVNLYLHITVENGSKSKDVFENNYMQKNPFREKIFTFFKNHYLLSSILEKIFNLEGISSTRNVDLMTFSGAKKTSDGVLISNEVYSLNKAVTNS